MCAEKVTLEHAIGHIQRKVSVRGFLLLLLLLTAHMLLITAVYFPNIGGYIPYNEWRCNQSSVPCKNRTEQYRQQTGSSPYNDQVLCGRGSEPALVLHQDFLWELATGRTTYAVEWNLFCAREWLGTLISSLYFVGGVGGLLVGAVVFDTVGRKAATIAGYIIVSVSMVLCAAVPNIPAMMALRVVLGMGSYIAISGMHVMIMEYSATRWRAAVNCVAGVMWSSGGMLIFPGMGFIILDWRWLTVSLGLAILVATFPWFLIPESPRHLLENKGKEGEAVRALRRYAELCGSNDYNLDSINLASSGSGSEVRGSVPFLRSLNDFRQYGELAVQLGVQTWQWFVIAFLYYGFSFGWNKLGTNIFLSYVFAGIGELVSMAGSLLLQEHVGRKKTLIVCFLAGSAGFLLALTPLSLGTQTVMTMEQLMCLVGSTSITGAFSTVYLYVTEQSPTAHRGKMLAVCSLAARAGSFCGPQAGLLFTWNRPVTLLLFSALSCSAGLVTLRLPETVGLPCPTTAREVQDRRKTGREKVLVLTNCSLTAH